MSGVTKGFDIMYRSMNRRIRKSNQTLFSFPTINQWRTVLSSNTHMLLRVNYFRESKLFTNTNKLPLLLYTFIKNFALEFSTRSIVRSKALH